ncbi:MAG TPA: RNA polymerase subunit sigma-70 [Polyangiaceae bacterium]|jgi:RNA polymerase sigma-70 factor (ECF subfamily)|nr:RNA polymerase subunit sigma-70 [Polyangiaceae bacterium]
MHDDSSLTLKLARGGDEQAFRQLVEPHRRELRAYCYRMAGSLEDAEDLLQDSLIRAWRGLAAFEGRSSLRTWLYRVTWSACVDALEKKPARALVVDASPASDPRDPIPPPRADDWIGPCNAALYADDAPSPEARYSARESVALAFLAALQLLPAKQRAALLARDVLGWSAEECAEMLGGSVASANSLLQRARETIEARGPRFRARLPDEPTTRSLLGRYVAAWEGADVSALVSLLHEEATLAMPPLPIWLSGPAAIGASIAGMVLTPEARGAFRLIPTEANGLPALAAYRRGEDGSFTPFAIHVLSLRDDRIDAITAFLDPRLFERFGLPASV